MSDRSTAGKGVSLRRTLPPEVFLLIMEAILDDAESSNTSQVWMISVSVDQELYLLDDEPRGDDFNKLQQSRFHKVRSVSQVNQMTQTMVRNRFSPLRCYSRRPTFAAHVLVFPKIDYMVPFILHCRLESLESALRSQSHHVLRFLQSFESARFHDAWFTEPEVRIKWSISLFPKLKVVFIPTYFRRRMSVPNCDTDHDHDHNELLLLSSDSSPLRYAPWVFESVPVPPALKLLWEKQIRIVGTAYARQTESEEAASQDQPICELVQSSQGLRVRKMDPECPLCKV